MQILSPFLLTIALFTHNFGGNTIYSSLVENKGTIKFIIHHKVKGEILELNSKYYNNPSNEKYTVNLFKYYISNIKISGTKQISEPNSYHLIDASKPNSQSFFLTLDPGDYSGISFMIGVDSLHNVSGAQTDDLDPLNGMFWTWNSGYIMAKMEGNSYASKNNNRYEFHIGGFEGENKAIQSVQFKFNNPIRLLKNSITEINLEADINEWWGNGNITISKNSIIASPGKSAKLISQNYSRMFKIVEPNKAP